MFRYINVNCHNDNLAFLVRGKILMIYIKYEHRNYPYLFSFYLQNAIQKFVFLSVWSMCDGYWFRQSLFLLQCQFRIKQYVHISKYLDLNWFTFFVLSHTRRKFRTIWKWRENNFLDAHYYGGFSSIPRALSNLLSIVDGTGSTISDIYFKRD